MTSRYSEARQTGSVIEAEAPFPFYRSFSNYAPPLRWPVGAMDMGVCIRVRKRIMDEVDDDAIHARIQRRRDRRQLQIVAAFIAIGVVAFMFMAAGIR